MTDTEDKRPERPRFHGRRSGKRLRRSALHLMDTALPRLEIPVPAPGDRITDPKALFAVPVEQVWLEVGFGGGEHVAEQARLHPEAGIIACEVFRNGVASLLSHLDETSIETVRVFADDVRLLFPALPEASLSRVFVLFPDPWPKTRHADRRFIGPENLDTLARLMADGGELRVASDDPVYQKWAAKHLAAHPAFDEVLATRDRSLLPADWPQTRYEKKCITGNAPMFFLYRRKAR